MTSDREPVDPLVEHFDRLHADGADPWDLSSSWYERRKQVLTVAALPRQRYRSAFEPGCSVGALTELLAPRCDQLLAADAATNAVESSRSRMTGHRNVTVERRHLPGEWPSGPFDLVVLSDLGYYLDAAALAATLERLVASAESGATVLAVHWRRVASDFRLAGGDDVHSRLHRRPELAPIAHYEENEFVLDVWERT